MRVAAGAGPREYLPVWVKLQAPIIRKFLAVQPRLTLDATSGSASVTSWASRRIRIDVDLSRRVDLVVRQFYFPGWQARAAALDDTVIEVAPAYPTGLLKLNAPPGRYEIRLELTRLWPEKLGILMTGIGLLLLILQIWLSKSGRGRTALGG
jgi:hypothetical protein